MLKIQKVIKFYKLNILNKKMMRVNQKKMKSLKWSMTMIIFKKKIKQLNNN